MFSFPLPREPAGSANGPGRRPLGDVFAGTTVPLVGRLSRCCCFSGTATPRQRRVGPPVPRPGGPKEGATPRLCRASAAAVQAVGPLGSRRKAGDPGRRDSQLPQGLGEDTGHVRAPPRRRVVCPPLPRSRASKERASFPFILHAWSRGSVHGHGATLDGRGLRRQTTIT